MAHKIDCACGAASVRAWGPWGYKRPDDPPSDEHARREVAEKWNRRTPALPPELVQSLRSLIDVALSGDDAMQWAGNAYEQIRAVLQHVEGELPPPPEH